MDICLIQVPFHAGDDRHDASSGPRSLLAAGADQLISSHGVAVTVEHVDRTEPFRDTASSSAQVNKQLAALVRRSVEAKRLPIVVAGSCNACLGVLAGFDHTHCGAVWLDAHADFNTPGSTASGFFPGMSLAIATGHCYGDYWEQIGDNTPLNEETIVMFGVRDLSPDAERERLRRSPINAVEWRNGRPRGDLLAPLEEIRHRVQDVYVHVDFDAFAPEIAPGIADEPVPGGLSLADAEEIIRATGDRFRIRAATLATYAPERDREGRTLRLALRMIELLADYAANMEARADT